MKYCVRCVMPDTKPDLSLDEEGICNACRAYENRSKVDWDQRRAEFIRISSKYRSLDGSGWDCIVPVSGGKDSTYQVIKVLKVGLRPLCVLATTCDLTEIGRKNIENLKNLGVDLIEVSPNPLVRRKLNQRGLRIVGDVSWPEHVGIFTIPIQVAVRYRIPLIIWGENSQNEYGGPAAASENNTLDRRWLEEFGGLLGLRVSDLAESGDFKPADLIPYQYPSNEELHQVGVTGLFLGHYFPWDGYANALISQAHGFSSWPNVTEGSIVNYENLDNYQTAIHEYFKYLKFGFGRATDHACIHIRRGRLQREDAVDLILMHDGKFPSAYLGKPLGQILEPLEISLDEFTRICDRFTNKKIFRVDQHGQLEKDANGRPFLRCAPEK